VNWLLTDEDAETLWPRGQADIPAGMRVCADCWDELRGLGTPKNYHIPHGVYFPHKGGA